MGMKHWNYVSAHSRGLFCVLYAVDYNWQCRKTIKKQK